ncbi:MAG TPA: hypothetical protein VM778_06625 [Gemmatimonadota bacterium]|nr:hypothetical protein [Gemmatimonadota bacterium]
MTDEARDRTDEERVGELVRRNADAYHAPPETPREAIWARIEAERRGARPADVDTAAVVPIDRGSRRRKAWATAFAAAAVLALGVSLGRLSTRQETERAGTPVVAERTAPAPARPGTAAPAAEPVPETLSGDTDVPRGTTAEPSALAAAPADRAPARGPAPARAARPERQPPTDEPGPARRSPELYRLASVQMLGQAEALLVEYRTGDRMDPAVARWARDVLSSTRLLLDSPAAEDPAMRRLLGDLELVLAQIVQRAGGGDPLDDEMIERTIEDRGLLPRLRGAIPAGGGTT